MNASVTKPCITCGKELSGKFCSSCGEKVVDRQERTLKYFFLQVLNAFTFADTRAWKSLKRLFSQPGILPREYVVGRRKPFLSPLPLFFLINFLYFLVAPFDTFNTHFQIQLEGQIYSELIHDYGHQQLEKSKLDKETFIARYNSHSANISKSILLLFVVLFTVPLMILFYKKTSLYFEHLMFSLSFISFLLLGIFIILPYLTVLLQLLLNQMGVNLDVDWNGGFMVLFALLITGIYLGVGLKTFYQETWKLVLLKTPVLLFSLVFTLFLYRFLLFFATVWTI